MAERKPKPTAVKKLEGNPGKRCGSFNKRRKGSVKATDFCPITDG